MVTCFCFPLARNEDSITERDLDRLRRVFVGTIEAEVLSCTWEPEIEGSKVTSRCCVHDGMVRAMVKSPHLDDVFLTVGGRAFAIWKEDLQDEPIFRRRGNDWYGDGCWSSRPGIIALVRLDGCFELWDLKRRDDEPVLTQTISEKVCSLLQSNTKFLTLDQITGNSIHMAESSGGSEQISRDIRRTLEPTGFQGA